MFRLAWLRDNYCLLCSKGLGEKKLGKVGRDQTGANSWAGLGRSDSLNATVSLRLFTADIALCPDSWAENSICLNVLKGNCHNWILRNWTKYRNKWIKNMCCITCFSQCYLGTQGHWTHLELIRAQNFGFVPPLLNEHQRFDPDPPRWLPALSSLMRLLYGTPRQKSSSWRSGWSVPNIIILSFFKVLPYHLCMSVICETLASSDGQGEIPECLETAWGRLNSDNTHTNWLFLSI